MRKLITIALIFMATFIAIGNNSQQVKAQEERLIELDTWFSQNIFSTFFIMNSGPINIETDFDVLNLSFYIPRSNFNTAIIGGQPSEIVLLDSGGATVANFSLTSIKPGAVGGLYTIDVSAFPTAVSAVIFIAQTYSTTPAGYVDYYNNNSYMLLREPFIARFYNESNNVIQESSFIGTPPSPPFDPADTATQRFAGWFIDGIEEFRFNSTYNRNIDVFMIFEDFTTTYLFYGPDGLHDTRTIRSDRNIVEDSTIPAGPTPPAPGVQSFAFWTGPDGREFDFTIPHTGTQILTPHFAIVFELQDTTVPAPTPPTTPTPPLENFLMGLGLYNTEGFLFLFALVIILVNFALVYYQLGLGLIIVSNIIISGLFIFLQFLPFWASFLFVSVIVFTIMLINGGMTKYE